MVVAGVARAHRVGLRRQQVVIAREGDTGPAWVSAGLINAVRTGRPLDDHRRFLLRLAEQSSIGRQLLDGADVRHVHRAREQAARVWPPWQELLDTAVRSVRDGALAR